MQKEKLEKRLKELEDKRERLITRVAVIESKIWKIIDKLNPQDNQKEK